MGAKRKAADTTAEEPPAKAAQPEQQKKENDKEKSAGQSPAAGRGQSSASGHSSVSKPKLPPADGKEKDEPAKPMMKKLLPWVHQELVKSLRADGTLRATETLSDLRPLTISSTTTSKSYKEHWVPEHCVTSFNLNGLYEAGGSMFWIDPEIAGDFEVPNMQPTWSLVCQIESEQFTYVGGESGRRRILFPVPLSAKWNGAVDATAYPTRLVALGGHAFIYGWYVRVFKALDSGDAEAVRMLLEAALTVTVTAWKEMDEATAAIQSIKLSETIRSAAKVMTDSFVTFMDKICLANGIQVGASGNLNQNIVTGLQKDNVRYDGGLVNVSMIRSINSIRLLLTPRGRELMSLIERGFGLKVLTGSYNKLRMLANGCSKAGPEGMDWCIEAMYMSLTRQTLEPGDFKNEVFLKGKDGSPSWISMALATKQVCAHLASLAEGVSKVDADLSKILLEKVVAKVAGPMLYNKAFPCAVSKNDTAHDDVADVGGSDVEEAEYMDLVGELGSTACRGAVLLAEAYKKTFDGAWDDGLEGLVAHPCPETALSELDVDTLKATMTGDLKELMRSLHAAENVVKATGSVPQASLRSLVRQHSDGADPKAVEAERADVWKRAQTQRRKFVTLALVKNATAKASYQEVLNKRGGDVAKFQGRPGEEVRMFAMSADLLNQSGDEPWKKASEPEPNSFKAILEFLSGCRGVADATVAFDGCVAKVRRQIEDDLMRKISGDYQELFVVYNKSWNDCFKKKMVFGSDNVEIGFVALPGNRSRVEIKERDGGESSHFRSMSGVVIPPRMSLPRVSHEDKKKIFADTPDITSLPKKWRDQVPSGEPLNWQETKSRDFWLRVLQELSVKAVVDVSPGSGSLGVACMEAGVSYFGICQSNVHFTWLGNVLDRAALQYVSEAGTHLYQEDLAAHVKEIFSDMLQTDEDGINDDALAMSDDE